MTPERLAKIRALIVRSADIGKAMSADLLAALEASEAARVKAEQERGAERERCAKIAETHGSKREDKSGEYDEYYYGADMAAIRIAAAIRNQESKP